RGLRCRTRARDVLPHRLPRAELRPCRLARARPRPASGASRRLLPQLREGRLARAGAVRRPTRRSRARCAKARTPARGARGRGWRTGTGAGTTTGGPPVLINEMPRYEILDEAALQARNPERSVHIGGKHMVFSAVYGCPFVREGLERRNATYHDFQNLVKLSQSFPQLDSPGGTICEPDDVPLDSRHLDMVYALL